VAQARGNMECGEELRLSLNAYEKVVSVKVDTFENYPVKLEFLITNDTQ